jgi:NTE family protein
MRTIGFRIDHAAQTKMDAASMGLAPQKVYNLKSYFGAFYTLVIESLNRQQLSEKDWQRTVSIDDGGIGPRIRKLRAAEINTLVEGGRVSALKFLQGYEPIAH